MDLKKNYIDGEWVPALSGGTREIINPATGEVIAKTAEGNIEDVRLAIAAAKEAFYVTGEWRRMDSQKRADIILKIADIMEERREELARTDTLDNGKPLREAEGDVDDAIHCFRYYAGMIKAPYGGVYDVNDNFGRMHSYTIHEPIGVCGQITPWNYPLLMAVWKIAPALSAGNCIVFKPSTNTPLSSVILFEIMEKAGVPRGTVNLVMGAGGSVGHEIAASPDVDMVTFTGSTEVGQDIARAAIGNLKKVGLELGGKSPNVIFADADFEGAVEWAMIGIFFNQGEVCSAGSRIIIEESIKDKFVARLAERANAMTLGNGLDNPDMGPLVSEAHMNTVLNYIETGKKEGADLVCGGCRYTEGECAGGYFVRPAIFDNCTPDMTIVREEIFGPVVTIQTFRREEEAIKLANDTIYGLAGAVFTTDGARALRVIKEIRAGITWINCYNPTYNEAPWGGYKMSGYGRELGIQGLEEYQEVKQVNINLTPGIAGWYEER
ncbi:betaine-aldehyde dehydrogenase [Anaerocolumna jejuensis DSM 15929]|uniref:Betaine-aldehyde dehydrogenase n=1 Tax=Anaerocolumna jejuensis DSM 15929 TaxID=1121322 RepID=A0A1M6M963_9FIRM|nr:aldehyde dehydrogenase family protein [Anaerocolumna jejuensis]SHJ79995.1 betaine-aldehyde dehydrogenase [Anaerocolumna jejuensis DSM 15929]